MPADISATPIRRVAFGEHLDWVDSIRSNLDAVYAPSFVDLATVHLRDYDAVVPLMVRHYEALARCPELLGRKFLHPSPAAVSLCDDKLRLTEFLVAQGFGRYVPPIRRPGAPYPYVWKKRRGAWGRECYVVDGPEAERTLDLTDPDWFAQSLARGRWEFATHILRTDGTVRYCSTFAYKMSGRQLIRGARNLPQTTRFKEGCRFLHLFGEMLSAIGYEGTACFNYKVARARPAIFEINPRYGASLNHDVTAYVDAYMAALRKAASSPAPLEHSANSPASASASNRSG